MVMNSTASMSPAMSPDVSLLAGPQLLGAFLAWGLQGVLTLQFYMYYMWFPQDRLLLKLFVGLIFIWEWVQVGLVTQTYFEIYVYDYGNLQSMTSFHNTWFSAPVMTAVVSFSVQCFFARRIWIFSRSKILLATILFLSFAQAMFGMAGGVMLATLGANAVQETRSGIVLAASCIGAAVDDAIIAGSMTYLLLRSKSGIKRSDAMVHKLVRLSIETGAITAAVALVNAVTVKINANNLLYECPALVLPKLYSNSLLVSLNNRALIAKSDGVLPSFLTSLKLGDPSTPANETPTTSGDGSPAVGAHGVQLDVPREMSMTSELDTTKKVLKLVEMGGRAPSRSFSG